MTLFDRVFGGNDYNYARTVAAIDAAIAQYGEAEPVAFPATAYNLPCYYSITGKKINNLGELKAALENDVKPMMTRNNRLQDVFDSGIASALCAEFLEVLKYLHGAEPYAEPEMGFLTDAFVRNLGVPLVTQDIPGVAVIIGGAEDANETVELAKSYQNQGILVTLTGEAIRHCHEAGMKLGEGVRLCEDIKRFFGGMSKETGTLWEYKEGKGSRDHGFASYAAVAIDYIEKQK